MKRFSVALNEVVLAALEQVAQQQHWSRERAARRLIVEALRARGHFDSPKPAEVIHRDRSEFDS